MRFISVYTVMVLWTLSLFRISLCICHTPFVLLYARMQKRRQKELGGVYCLLDARSRIQQYVHPYITIQWCFLGSLSWLDSNGSWTTRHTNITINPFRLHSIAINGWMYQKKMKNKQQPTAAAANDNNIFGSLSWMGAFLFSIMIVFFVNLFSSLSPNLSQSLSLFRCICVFINSRFVHRIVQMNV